MISMISMAARRPGLHGSKPARSVPPPDRPPAPAPPPPPRWRNWLLVVGLLLTAALWFLPIPTGSKPQQLTYTQLKTDIAAGQVASVALGSDGSISGKLTNGTSITSSYPTTLQDPQFAQLLDEHHVQVTTQSARTSIWSVVLNLLPLAIIVGLFIWTGRSARRQLAGLGAIGRSRAKVFDLERPDTTFADIAGYEGAKQEVTEVIDFLKHPDRYRRAGAVGPKGVLMVGPPGTGKTLLARAVAGEPRCRSSPSPDPASWRCSWGWAPPGSATSSPTLGAGHPASSSSTRSTRSASAAAVSSSPTTSATRP
jgi:cell division protease FtsH